MKILTAWSSNFKPMYDRWLRTLPNCFEPNAKLIQITQDKFGFATQSWYDAIKYKIQHFIDVLSNSPDGEIVICSDCDIFFTNSSDALKNYIIGEFDKQPLDFLFMREAESQYVNGGFYVVKNSLRVRSILQKAKEYCNKKSPLADQDFFNGDGFRKSDVKWTYIDYKLVAWGNHVFDKSKTLFHHAVCCRNIKEKIKQQDKISRTFGIVLPRC